ncbi:hypothetical protein, partial [Planktothricoides sp. SR001]|uniref:hypothetical protein n=1 Tax=Planktothricoides sp. SR001 TaxID=1705388 RepID=UPI001E60E29C
KKRELTARMLCPYKPLQEKLKNLLPVGEAFSKSMLRPYRCAIFTGKTRLFFTRMQRRPDIY